LVEAPEVLRHESNIDPILNFLIEARHLGPRDEGAPIETDQLVVNRKW